MTTHTFRHSAHFDELLKRFCNNSVEQFRAVIGSYALFHLTFIGIGLIELFCFIFFFSFFLASSLLAFSLAALVFTAFSYFVLLFYFQAKKPEQLIQLQNKFFQECQSALSHDRATPRYHLYLAHALHQFVNLLDHQEKTYYSLPNSMKKLSSLLEKFSIFIHWEDVQKMRELLFALVIKEHIEFIKINPLDLEAHVALGNAYLQLAKIYRRPDEWVLIPAAFHSKEMKEKENQALHKALQEFEILKEFSPNDPWVHGQIASIYRQLDRFQEEIREYEAMLRLIPDENNILLRLGILYFQQGENAKGLRLYHQLRTSYPKEAEELIGYYS